MRRYVLLGVLALIAGCSTSTESLEQSKSAVRAEKSYTDNYQEVYRRLVDTARRCAGVSNSAYTSFQVDSDLYNELGYGEIAFSLQDLGARNYYWKAKISKVGSGSRLNVVSGNTLAQDRTLKSVIRWADGGSGC